MKENKFDKKVFDAHVLKIMEINEHYDDCEYAERTAPIDVCACDCYKKQIFLLGREAEEKLFYGGSDRASSKKEV